VKLIVACLCALAACAPPAVPAPEFDLCALIQVPFPALARLERTIDDGRPQCRRIAEGRLVLSISDDDDPVAARVKRAQAAVEDLAGTKAYRRENRENGCSYAIPVSFTRSIDVAAYEREDPCSYAREFARLVVGRIAADPATRPLLYAPDERDTDAIGACANLVVPGNSDCRPAGDTLVPDGVDHVMSAATQDPDIACAVFTAAIAETYGREFEPVLARGRCYFVRPALGLQIETDISGIGEPLANLGLRSFFDVDRTELALSGRAAVAYRSLDARQYSVSASPYGDLRRPGHVRIVATAMPTRGVAGEDLADPDPAKTVKAMDQVLARYFS
jgi:hypothetical protein